MAPSCRLAFAVVSTIVAFAGAEESEAPAEPEVAVEVPLAVEGASFFEPFLPDWEDTWKVSKDADFSGRWKLESYSSGGDDKGLVVSDPARKHAVSTLFASPFDPKGQGLVIQYELQLKNGLQCGGACARPPNAPPPRTCRRSLARARLTRRPPLRIPCVHRAVPGAAAQISSC